MGKKVIKYKGVQPPSNDELRTDIFEIGEKMRAEEEARRKAAERAHRKSETIEEIRTLAIGIFGGLILANIILWELYFIFR